MRRASYTPSGAWLTLAAAKVEVVVLVIKLARLPCCLKEPSVYKVPAPIIRALRVCRCIVKRAFRCYGHAMVFGKQRTTVDRVEARTRECRSVESPTMMPLVPSLPWDMKQLVPAPL